MFESAIGFKATLKCRLLPEDVLLPLYPGDAARLAGLLDAPGAYTRLWVGDGVAHEIVKATGVVDGAVTLERGQEGTRAAAMPVGACVSFVWTEQCLSDFIAQGLGGRVAAVCSVVAGSDRVSVATEGCAVTVDVPACQGQASWRSGNVQFTQGPGGCIGTQPVALPLVDGEYDNATLTVREGQIVAVRPGTNIVYSGGGGCGGCGGGCGCKGEPGPMGPQGPQGQPGVAGPMGPEGWRGAMGFQGLQGAAGADGQDGAGGSGTLGGMGPPGCDTGEVGDFYIDRLASAMYGPKSADGWGEPTSLVGAAGADGKDGVDGKDGASGTDGSNGAEGTSGGWSMAQSGDWLHVVGVPGKVFSVESSHGVQIVPETTMPAEGRIAVQMFGYQSGVVFIKSQGLYVGTGSVVYVDYGGGS